MSELLKRCEQDFLQVLTGANKKLAMLAEAGNPDFIIRDVKIEMQEADKILHRFESELRSSSTEIAHQYKPRMQRYIENITQMKRTIANEEQRRQKRSLMGIQPDGQREKGTGRNEVVQESGLERTLKVGIESELLANDIVGSLKSQRKKIVGISEKVNDIDVNIGSAKQVISRMDHRRVWMKVLMLFTILLLLSANGAVLYIKLK